MGTAPQLSRHHDHRRIPAVDVALDARDRVSVHTPSLGGHRSTEQGSVGVPVLATAVLPAPTLTPAQQFVKRCFDLAVGVTMFALATPLVPLLALCIRLTGRGPILFRQPRVGRNGELFEMFKFRTMHTDAESLLRRDPELYDRYLRNGFKLPADDDPRITPLGRFLRKSSLDELPQLLNVLRGDMSIVGPRPVVPDEVGPLYGDLANYYLNVKPGLTGLWQVSGRSNVSQRERAELDVRYLATWSLWRDVLLLVKTVPAVIKARGAY